MKVIVADNNLPTVGVFIALSEADDDNEEELSARAKGAEGGGLELEVKGGLNGLGWQTKFKNINLLFKLTMLWLGK